MGIKGLSKLIAEKAPEAITNRELKFYAGYKIAIDASMCLYSFMVAIRTQGNSYLTTADGEDTSHLQGLFYRTAKLLKFGLKPVFVFDGKPPDLKLITLRARKERKQAAKEAIATAREEGNKEALETLSKQNVRVTQRHNDEAKELLRLMGVPVVESPCEAEAQCAYMARQGLVDRAGSDDMDTLTFDAPIQLRHLTHARAGTDHKVQEIDLAVVLEKLELTMDQFIDMCILCGCDYAGTIRGVGPSRSFDLIRKHGSLEKAVASIDREKHNMDDSHDLLNQEKIDAIRVMFKQHEVMTKETIDAQGTLKFSDPDEAGLLEFLCHDRGFSEDRVRSVIKAIVKNRGASRQSQLTSFFGKPIRNASDTAKRKKAEKGKKKGKKRARKS